MNEPELLELRRLLVAATYADLERSQVRRMRSVATVAAVTTVTAGSTMMLGGVAAATDAASDLAAQVMDVFRRDATGPSETKVPREFAEENEQSGAMTPEIPQPAEPTSPDAGRLLLAHEEPGIVARIYATPTKDGQSCFIAKIDWDDDDQSRGGACIQDLDAEWPISVLSGGIRPDAPTAIYGIASDAVASVRVRADGVWTDAVMGENAVIWFAQHDLAIPDQIEVRLRDGSTHARPFHLDRPAWLGQKRGAA
ncbi:MAG: hypothetical protein JWM90_1566 [Thermoleophilia bacterium]|nr:hypothetical protein [Thermoleophilia bacterium]